jgi:phenylacetic acid degradation operon negative regulatory protein
MKARTEELLYLLLWGADQLARPTFRNLTDSFESWAYKNGFLRQIEELEARKILERQPGSHAAAAIYRLSESGRLLALGGRDPIAQWTRPWDGRWRMVLFDLPEARASARVKLRRFLQNSGFGFLQNSVWITPDPLNAITRELSAHAEDVESLITLEARPAAHETDADIVAGAWNFDKINRHYERSLRILKALPQPKSQPGPAAESFRRWATLEKTTWHEAVTADPLLPDRLLPAGYLGKKVWAERTRILALAHHLTHPG